MPLIPGYNDSVENLEAVARFGLEIGAEKVSLLPYHIWGKSKYERLGRKYPMEDVPLPPDSLARSARRSSKVPGHEGHCGQVVPEGRR